MDKRHWSKSHSCGQNAWLLSLHPSASGRVYAAYGGVYVAVALLWLWRIDGVAPTIWDLFGVAVTLIGMAIIVWGLAVLILGCW